MRPSKVYQESDIHIERTDEYGRTLTPKKPFGYFLINFMARGLENEARKAHEAVPRTQVEADEEFRYAIHVCGEDDVNSSSITHPILFSAVMKNRGMHYLICLSLNCFF